MKKIILVLLAAFSTACATSSKTMTTVSDAINSKPIFVNPETVIQYYYKLSNTPVPTEGWLGRSAKSFNPQFVTEGMANNCGYVQYTHETVEPCKKVADSITRHMPKEGSFIKIPYRSGHLEPYDFTNKMFYYCLQQADPSRRDSNCPASSVQAVSVYNKFAFEMIVEGKMPIAFKPKDEQIMKALNSMATKRDVQSFIVIKPYATEVKPGLKKKTQDGYEDHSYYPNKHIVKAKLAGIEFVEYAHGVPKTIVWLEVGTDF